MNEYFDSSHVLTSD